MAESETRPMVAADTIRGMNVPVKRCPDCGARFGVDAQFCPFCGVPLATDHWDPMGDPLIGQVVDNRYEVIAPLGEGGMGTVYRVRHVTLNRFFAMKALRRDLATDAALSERFLQEARATAAIKHPFVVSISDFGILDKGTPYFVMELLVGETLAVRLRARGALPPREAIAIARNMASALAASHAANVIHRDLKPENVFLVGSDDLRVVDFGAAKIVGGSKLTRPGVVFGTPYYMSPEQAGGQPVDARADVYSLGVLLFEMLTGRVPFEAETYMGVLTKHLFAAPPKPSEAVAAGVHLGSLEDVVMRALEKDPRARFATMADLDRALEEADTRHLEQAPAAQAEARAPLGAEGMSTAERIERSIGQQLAREQRQRRKEITVAISVTLVTVLLGFFVFAGVFRGNDSSDAKDRSAKASGSTANASPAQAPPSSAAPTETATVPETATASAPSPSAPVAKSTPKWAPPKVNPIPQPPSAPTSTAGRRRPDDFSDPWQK
jgi:serine/threonine-protein kinase